MGWGNKLKSFSFKAQRPETEKSGLPSMPPIGVNLKSPRKVQAGLDAQRKPYAV